MNRKEALYKRKNPGLASRDVRARLKVHESKMKRDDLLASKRRIPLSVIQEQSKPSPKLKKLSKEEQSKLRLEKLKEWKKARDIAKMKAKQAKKPFVPVSIIVKPREQKNIFHKPWSTNTSIASNKSGNKLSIPVFNPKPAQKSASKSAPKPVLVKQSQPTIATKQSRTTALSSTVKFNTQKTKPAAKSVSVTRPAPKKQLTTKPKKEELEKTVNSHPQTRSKTRSAVSKVKAESKKSTSSSTQIRTRNGTKQALKSPPDQLPRRVVTASSITKVTTTDTQEMTDISVEVTNIPINEENIHPPMTPPPTKRYDPIHPSPLLRSHSAKRRETQFSIPPPITDPVWIPGQINMQRFAQPNFDDAFGDFSPFMFGGSGNNYQFTFRKELSFSSDSLESGSDKSLVTPDSKIVRKSLGLSSVCKSPSVRNVSVDEGAMVVEVVNNDTEESHTSEMEIEIPIEKNLSREPAKPAIDIEYFRLLHSNVVADLTSMCDKWEEKAISLEDQCDGDMEEALGQVRTTVCQGRLLMRQKLKQYSGLVDMAESQSGERETTAEDLQGFWDMVYFQVEDVHRKFCDLETLEKNNWTVKAPTPKKKKITKKCAPKKTASSAEESERAQAAREKREAQRNRLRELKMAAKRAREEAAVDNTENVGVVTPKKSKIEDLSPKTGSAYKNGRRCSMRLRNRSIFSPCSTEKPFQKITADVPVASLISFD